ncbi:MAG: PHP domain-containing protein [Deltaproteobacteria bacterium]|nr:PHP domain-containing protein [Deltaproteobacteria bacterium]MBW2362411.1 PHP domain-containing protein [Deltaproteobacteria bacterium]
MMRTLVLAVLLFSSTTAPAAGVALQAERLSQDNWEALFPGGPDAIGGLGDWALSNGRLCAVISDLDHESGVTPFGGILVDLGHCGQANDQWLMAHFAPNMATEKLTRPDRIEAGRAAAEAFVVVTSRQWGLQLQTRYSLDNSDPDTLLLSQRLTRTASGPALNSASLMVLHPGRSLTPYALSTQERRYSLGFDLLPFDREDQKTLLEAMQPGDINILMGADGLGGEISYGVQLLSARRYSRAGEPIELSNFVTTASNHSLFGMLSEQPWLARAKPGMWEMLQSRWMDLAVGESLELRFRILVRPANDVAAITNSLYRGTELSGRIEPSASRLALFDDGGRPLTSVRPAADGSFRVTIPVGVEQLRGELAGRTGRASFQWRIDGSQMDVGTLSLPRGARLELPRGHPMRLTFKGNKGTPDPDFFSDHTGFNSGGKPAPNSVQANYVSLAGVGSDLAEIELPVGSYRVYASRGLEFQVTETELELSAGEQRQLEMPWPTRVLETPGWVNADLHVHSGASFDSALPLRERVRSFAAAGAEILVASEHNRLIDYRHLLREMDLERELVLISGVEFTGMAHTAQVPFTNGHSNVFPLQYRAREFSGGLPRHEGVRLRELMQWTREHSPTALFQLNHPRVTDAPDPALAYFDHLGVGQQFDPLVPLSAESNRALIETDERGGRDIDFDLLEVLNGSDMERYRLVQRDWFSLLRQGERSTATANSDSHKSATLVGIPTNYVALADAAVVGFDESGFLRALKAGRAFGTTGPVLDVSLLSANGAVTGLGETFRAAEGQLRVGVRAAPWVPVDTLTVYLNGEGYHHQAIVAGDVVELPLKVAADSFVVVEVSGSPDTRYRAVIPDFVPLAFSNPIWIDADGDGSWQAPGL